MVEGARLEIDSPRVLEVVGDPCSGSNQSLVTKKPEARPAVYRNRRSISGHAVPAAARPTALLLRTTAIGNWDYDRIARAFCVCYLTVLPRRNGDHHIEKNDEERDDRRLDTER